MDAAAVELIWTLIKAKHWLDDGCQDEFLQYALQSLVASG